MRTLLPANAVLVPDEAKVVFKGVIYDTYHWEEKLFDGTTAIFEMLKRPDTVKVLAIVEDKLVVLEQSQPGIAKPFFDIPGGMHDHDDEDELQAVQRELLEEAGLRFRNWKLLNVVQPNKKIEQFVYMFLATDLVSEETQRLDGGEKIQVHFMTYDEAKEVLSSERGRYLPDELRMTRGLHELLQLAGE